MRSLRCVLLPPPPILLAVVGAAFGVLFAAGSAPAYPTIHHEVIDPIHHREVVVPDSLRENGPESDAALAPESDDVFDADRDDDIIRLDPYDEFDDDRGGDAWKARPEGVLDDAANVVGRKRGSSRDTEPVAAAPDRARVFPNPSMGPVTVETGSGHLLLEVYDASGRRVMSVEGSTGRATWNGRDSSGRIVPPGVYFGRIAGENSSAQAVRIVRR
jgi:hypothetical protein